MANQTKFLDMVNNGEDIILKSREKGSFKLVPVSKNDMLINKEYILEPDADFERTISFDEFKEKALNHIKELYNKEAK
jgi:antitoxin (DNA-binding transcriptional repressor) of toxin-antitoxin stability system